VRIFITKTINSFGGGKPISLSDLRFCSFACLYALELPGEVENIPKKNLPLYSQLTF